MRISFVSGILMSLAVGFISCDTVAATLPSVRAAARPSVRQISPTTSATRAATSTARAATTPTRAATNSNSRLSIGRLHTNSGKVSTSPGTSGGGTPPPEVDLSGYATLSQLGAVESDIVDLELEIGGVSAQVDAKANATDVYMKSEVDGIISALELNGVQGEKGDKGDKGDTGDIGLSAYEVAVANGFDGTQAQWLESLKGADGDIGDIDLSDYATKSTTYTKIEIDAIIDSLRELIGGENPQPGSCNPALCPSGWVCPTSGQGDCYDPNAFEW